MARTDVSFWADDDERLLPQFRDLKGTPSLRIGVNLIESVTFFFQGREAAQSLLDDLWREAVKAGYTLPTLTTEDPRVPLYEKYLSEIAGGDENPTTIAEAALTEAAKLSAGKAI